MNWPMMVAVFFATAILDAIWTLYIEAVSMRRAWTASLSNGAIIGLGAMLAVNYVNDRSLIWAAIVGGFVGTFAIMRWRK